MEVFLKESIGYNRDLSQAERNILAWKETNWHYVTPATGSFKGHIDGSIAREENRASVVDSMDDAAIMSCVDTTNIKGTRLLFGFSKKEFTKEEAEILTANLYKLIVWNKNLSKLKD